MQSPSTPTSSRLSPETAPPDGLRSPLPSSSRGGLVEARVGAKRPQHKPAQRQRARAGGAGSRPQEGPNPAAPTTPSLTLLGICEQRLRNAAQRERAEERGSPHPPQPALRLLTGRSGRPEAPTQPLHPARVAQRSREPRPLARLRPRAPEPRWRGPRRRLAPPRP